MQVSTAASQAGPPLPAAALALAPLHLRSHRRMRCSGDDLYVRLGELASRDQTLLRQLYQQLTELLYTIADTKTTDAQKWEGIERWLGRYDLEAIINEVREIGHDTHLQNPGENFAKAMHDIRGGALSPLLGRLQLLGYLRTVPEALNILFVQARDHLKIMRNAIVGLDDPRRDADRKPKAHAMQLMINKWHDAVVGPRWQERPIRLEIDCRYEGPLTECCLESAAVDRIFYNLAANACRHTDDERLEMLIFPVPEPPGECLRFVLSNRVSEAHVTRLLQLTGDSGVDDKHSRPGRDLLPLFTPEVSSTGSGFGLKVVADFVADAFGLRDAAEALQGRYAGAVLDEETRTFQVWFHWPMAHDNLLPKLDDYHHPEQSLSEP